VLQLDDALPAALGLRELEIDLPVVGRGSLNLLHSVDLLELGLGLCGFGVLRAKAIDEFHEPADLAFLVLEGCELLLLEGLPLVEVIVVVATVTNEPALANLDNVADQIVEEFAIMR